MHTLIAILALATPVGFDVNVLTPVLPGTSTTSTVTAINPFDGVTWMSNGQTLYELDGLGGITSSESIIGGNPVAGGGVTTDLVFGLDGTMYVNDFSQDRIYRRAPLGSWTILATVNNPRGMALDALGNLIVLGNNSTPDAVGTAYSVSPLGVVTTIANTQGESFELDALGDMIIPHYLGTGVDRLTMAGNLTTLFSWDRPVPILYEAISLNQDGHYIIGVNLGADESETFNRSQIIRVDSVTGERTVIGEDIIVGVLPVDLIGRENGNIVVSGFGSLIGFELVAIPEPSTLSLLMLAAPLAIGIRRASRR